jgi:hypothetical protein
MSSRAARFAALLAALTLLVGGGCGGGSAYAPASSPRPVTSLGDDSERVALLSESLEDLEAALDEELAAAAAVTPAAPPDAERCEQACNLCFNICALSESICAIAARHRDSASLGAQCLEGRVRCKLGTRDTEAVCDCSESERRIRI